jgi:signal transduction histidine kinase
MTNPFESGERLRLAANNDGTYKKLAVEAANQALRNRPPLYFKWMVLGGYGLLFAVALAVCFAGKYTLFGIQIAPVTSYGVMLLITGLLAHFISKRFLYRIGRLTTLTQRIAKGDLSFIGPVGKFRDEFTVVNMAMNRMLAELDVWHTIMEESHQLTAIGTLTAGVAHQINNPLNNIILTAHTFKEEDKILSDQERKEMIDDLIQEAERTRKIVRNLQDFARESQCASETFDMGQLVQKTAGLAVTQVKAFGAELKIKVQPHLPLVHGDKRQWQQVFLNLVLNALDAVDKDGEIKIVVEKDAAPGFLAVHVENNGPAIPAHVLPYIFDPFFTTKAPGKGTGLGLSVSRGIVTRYGGRINVTSREGAVTRFTVLIPSTDIVADQCHVSPS